MKRKILGLTMSLVMTMGLAPNTMAEAAETVSPEVLIYRDYEDYSNGYSILNPSGDYGTWFNSAQGGSWSGAVATKGSDGKAVQIINGANEYWGRALVSNKLTSGKLYLSYDITPASTLTGNERIDIYCFSGDYNGYGSGTGLVYYISSLPQGRNKEELVIDLDSNTKTHYRNGVQVKYDSYEGDINGVAFSILGGGGIEEFDNFTMVHYPKGATPTFSIKSKGIDLENNALNIAFTSDAKTVTELKTYNAPYCVAFDDSAETNEAIGACLNVVDSDGATCTVEAITKGDYPGVYKLKLSDTIVSGKTYTVSVSPDAADIQLNANDGSVLNSDASASFEIVLPEVLYYRNYEDYVNGSSLISSSANYGTWKYGGGGNYGEIKSVKGSDGKAVSMEALSTKEYWDRGKFPSPLTSGKFYFSYEVTPADNLTGEEYVDIFGFSGEYTADFRPFGYSVSSLPKGRNKLEYIIDLDKHTRTYYRNGEQVKSESDTGGMNGIVFRFLNGGGIKEFDNLTMIHYPTNVIEQTFSPSVKGYSRKDNTLTVGFASDTESNGVKTAHNVSLAKELTADDFVVTNSKGDVAVKSVTKSGPYYVLAFDELAENETYSVSLNGTNYIDLLDAKLNNIPSTVSISKSVLADLTMDEYTGGGAFNGVLEGWTGCMQPVVHEKWGRGVDFVSPDGITKNTSLYVSFEQAPINKGKFMISFDYMSEGATGKAMAVTANNATGSGHAGGSGNLYLMDIYGNSFNVNKASNDWAQNEYPRYETKLYHVDLVLDYDTNKYTPYVNGEALDGYPLNSEIGDISVKKLWFDIDTATSFLDNFKMSYIEDGTFYIQNVERKEGQINLLLSEGAGADSHAIQISDVKVVEKGTENAATVSAVEVIGRRVMLTGEFDAEKEYTVTLPDSFKNIVGNSLNTAVTDVLPMGLNITGMKLVSDKNGTKLDKAAVNAGQKVYLEVKYQNMTGLDKTFDVIGAVYNNKALAGVKLENVSVSGISQAEKTLYVELDVINTEGLTFKSIAVESLKSLKPINGSGIEI